VRKDSEIAGCRVKEKFNILCRAKPFTTQGTEERGGGAKELTADYADGRGSETLGPGDYDTVHPEPTETSCQGFVRRRMEDIIGATWAGIQPSLAGLYLDAKLSRHLNAHRTKCAAHVLHTGLFSVAPGGAGCSEL